jgi:hypothetical protein
MTSAAEVFVVQLARASRKANRLVRHLQPADRNDILSAALAWCWEHRDSYSLTTSLDTWFVNAVRNAYQRWQRNELDTDQIAEIPVGDTALANVEAWQAVTKIAGALPLMYRRIALKQLQGYTRQELMKQGFSHDAIYNTRERVKQLRRLLPEDHEFKRALRTAPMPQSDEIAHLHNKGSNIDREIAQLEAMPKHGKDCPPCWRCKWFEGYLPGEHISLRMPIHEPEVRDAVRDTEARKIDIANEVRHACV